MTDRGAFEDWIPSDYLGEYYGDVTEDETFTTRYFVEQIASAPLGPVLCFGCGPTVHHVFSAAPRTADIYLADYVPANLAEIERFLRNEPGAHDWSPYVRYTLACETGLEPSAEAVAERTELLRHRVRALLPADAGLSDPLGSVYRGHFAVVLSAYCAESATGDRATWTRFCRNIASLVRPGGLLLTATLRLCTSYKSGPRFFAATPIDVADLHDVLRHDFREDSIRVEAHELTSHEGQGFSGILLARAVK